MPAVACRVPVTRRLRGRRTEQMERSARPADQPDAYQEDRRDQHDAGGSAGPPQAPPPLPRGVREHRLAWLGELNGAVLIAPIRVGHGARV